MFIMYDVNMKKKIIPQNKSLLPVTQLVGLSAMAARGIVEHFNSTGDDTLRGCQVAAVAFGKGLGEDISVPTVSVVARKLKAADILQGHKRGRTHYLRSGVNLNDFLDYLEDDPDYGSRMTGTTEDDTDRMKAFRIMEEYGAIRSNAVHNSIPSAAYAKLIAKVKTGEYEIIILKADLVAGVKYDGATVKPPYFGDED